MWAFVFRPQVSAVLYSESYYEIRREKVPDMLLFEVQHSLCKWKSVFNCFMSHHLPLSFLHLKWLVLSGHRAVYTKWELCLLVNSLILTQVFRMCVCFTQGARDTFENYYRKQRRKQARLVLQPHSNMVCHHSAWAHTLSDCLFYNLQSYSLHHPQSLTSPQINSQELWGKPLSLHSVQVSAYLIKLDMYS